MKEQFVSRAFSPDSMNTIEDVNTILDEYEQQRFKLTLRQLYYQLVSRGFIPNTVRSYKNLGVLVSNARQAGLIDWDMIEDRNRSTSTQSHWRNPSEIVRAAADSFHIDKWETQPCHVEVMVEKDALSGVLGPVTYRLDVGLTANKGYSSSSTMYEIGKRLEHLSDKGKQLVVLYLGDHDPSGIDMGRDVRDRLEMYSQCSVRVERLALNMEQVKQWNPPNNPAKETDARYASYVTRYGENSWELDAVEPTILANLVTTAVKKYRDEQLWNAAVYKETMLRSHLSGMADDYEEKHPEDQEEEQDDE